MDTSGMNAEAFAAERKRAGTAISNIDTRLAGIDGQIAELEREIARRRQAIDAMDTQLAELLSRGR